ncbi:MAG: DUF4892 domain-containing protein [Halioglobus sp.]
MSYSGKKRLFFPLFAVFSLLLAGCAYAMTGSMADLLQQLDDSPHARQVAVSEQEVIDHEVGLGAMQKIRGTWQFKKGERHSGLLQRNTWQIVDGFSSIEVMETLIADLQEINAASLLFSCDGRACGQGVQWANRVFNQRVLYGREDLQRYRVYALQDEAEYRLVIYSSSRTADRQYLHVDLLRIAD